MLLVMNIMTCLILLSCLVFAGFSAAIGYVVFAGVFLTLGVLTIAVHVL